jgi:hypothetical protein
MKVWLVEIFVYNTNDEYGDINFFFRKNKAFSQEVKARNYLRDFKKRVKNLNRYKNIFDGEIIDVYYNSMGYTDISTITEIEL